MHPLFSFTLQLLLMIPAKDLIVSKTLSKFYPFAGRLKDGFSIDCNDDVAMYIEANVECDMSMVLKQSEIDQLQQLLPYGPDEKQPVVSNQTLLAIQVNHFGCGGMAVGICTRHVIADASAAANFVKSWAAIACGANALDHVISDCTSLFPPQSYFDFSKNIDKNHDLLYNVVMKRFLFGGSKIAALKEKIGRIDPSLHYPTRFEAVSVLIWGAVIAIARERDEKIPMHVASIAVNLRNRMNPQLAEQSIGNIYQMTMANCAMENSINYNMLAGKVHEPIQIMNDEYVRKLHEGRGYMKFMRHAAEELGKRSNIEVFSFSSWCRFPFYEADFGWGKPVWFSTTLKLDKVAIFFDTSDGNGIEAWVGLSKDKMAKFEQDPGILTLLPIQAYDDLYYHAQDF